MTNSAGIINAQASNEDFEFAALAAAVNYRRRLLDEFSPYLKGSVLEVGAGIGMFTQELAGCNSIKEIVSLEPDQRFYTRLERIPYPVRCILGTIDNIPPAPAYDALVSVNVLEHIDDHLEELKKYRQRLRSGGHLCLFVPAGPSIYAPIDKSFGHYRRYTKSSLREVLQASGFRITKIHYYNCLGYFAWWLNFCVLKKMGFELGKVQAFDRYIFPTVHILESKVMRPPFGQSLMAIASCP
jgi:SAM-dependent methyltransferase